MGTGMVAPQLAWQELSRTGEVGLREEESGSPARSLPFP